MEAGLSAGAEQPPGGRHHGRRGLRGEEGPGAGGGQEPRGGCQLELETKAKRGFAKISQSRESPY